MCDGRSQGMRVLESKKAEAQLDKPISSKVDARRPEFEADNPGEMNCTVTNITAALGRRREARSEMLPRFSTPESYFPLLPSR